MTFLRVKRIKNRDYLYEEMRYREGKKVKSRSRYIGPVEALRILASNLFTPMTDEERIGEIIATAIEEGGKQVKIEKSAKDPVPIEKPPSTIDLSQKETPPAEAKGAATTPASEAARPSPADSNGSEGEPR